MSTVVIVRAALVAAAGVRVAVARAGDRRGLVALTRGLGQIPGIAANFLSERLKRLEREGLLVARPYSERPAWAAYQLTAEPRDAEVSYL